MMVQEFNLFVEQPAEQCLVEWLWNPQRDILRERESDVESCYIMDTLIGYFLLHYAHWDHVESLCSSH